MQADLAEADIVAALTRDFPDAQVKVELDGNRALIDIVSNAFAGMNRVKKQQSVYACIQDYIADGRLHAVTIKADTP